MTGNFLCTMDTENICFFPNCAKSAERSYSMRPATAVHRKQTANREIRWRRLTFTLQRIPRLHYSHNSKIVWNFFSCLFFYLESLASPVYFISAYSACRRSRSSVSLAISRSHSVLSCSRCRCVSPWFSKRITTSCTNNNSNKLMTTIAQRFSLDKTLRSLSVGRIFSDRESCSK
jgi:hypothetical protein